MKMSDMYRLLSLCIAILIIEGLQGVLGDVKRSDVYITADTTSGKVRGKVVSADSNSHVASFRGIPFAKPPTGNLRFQPPVAQEKWNTTKDALKFSNQCMQMAYPEYTFQVDDQPATYGEDCLYLNVYTPLANWSMASLPVMVWIHGGGYFIGSGTQYPGKSLTSKGVVLVTINYRLDVFGFMSTEDNVVPGNYGMLDQIAALKWVQSNIANFGGDPNLVTIFGESAGSSSVSLLILSPLAKGLFHRAIMESGSSTSPWATQIPANRVSSSMVARLVGAGAGCSDVTNSTNLMVCLQQVEAEKLLNISQTVNAALAVGMIYLPRVETVSGFLPELPINMLARGEFNHVDTIYGFNGHESYRPVLYDGMSSLDDVRKIMTVPQFNERDEGRVLKLMEATYFQNMSGATSDLWAQRPIQFSDDYAFVGPALVELHNMVPKSQEKTHYLYRFAYRPSFQKGSPKWMTSVHGDELGFVFGSQEKAFTDHHGSQPDADDLSVSRQVMEMWTNFAKTGVPTSTLLNGGTSWKQYSKANPNYLEITRNSTLKTWTRPVAQFFTKIIEIMDRGVPFASSSNNGIVG